MPLRMKSFKSNPLVLSLTSAFAGGLFLSVGVIHLLPEANENFQNYFGKDEDVFPWAHTITIISFTLILFIEKIATESHHDHGHSHSHDEVMSRHSSIKDQIAQRNQSKQQNGIFAEKSHSIQNDSNQLLMEFEEKQNCTDNCQFEEDLLRQQVNSKNQVAQQIAKKSEQLHEQNKLNLTPFILQIAIGIHAVFEGLAIGIETEWFKCLSIAGAVCVHKWAEGLTLGLAFRKAQIDLKTSSIMIFMQAIMNPMGVGIGWLLSGKGDLITGIFMSISAGTFLYIATLEVIVEEFNVRRYKYAKFLLFVIAAGFITSLWFIEKITGG